MKIRLFSKMIDEQLEFLLPRALAADLILFVCMLPFYGLDVPVILGLLLGTFTMTVNIVLLGISTQRAVERASVKSAQRYMFSFYLIRFTIMGAAVAAGFLLPCFNAVCTYIPLLWPKIIYTADAFAQSIKEKYGKLK